MRYTIQAFGIAKDIMGGRETKLDVTEASVGALKQQLFALYPELNALNTLMIAVNHAYASDDQVITDGDEIAIIPPVSGG